MRLEGGRWRENLSSGTECHFSCTFWAFAPVLVNLLLPWAFSSCLPVTLKAPCCTEHLKIHIICSKLRLASSSWTQPSEQSVCQEEKPAALSPLRGVCLLQYGMPLGDFQQEILTILWDFHLTSIMQGAAPVSQIGLGGQSRAEMGRRVNCPPCYLSISLLIWPRVSTGRHRRWFLLSHISPISCGCFGLKGMSAFDLLLKMWSSWGEVHFKPLRGHLTYRWTPGTRLVDCPAASKRKKTFLGFEGRSWMSGGIEKMLKRMTKSNTHPWFLKIQ